MIKETSYTADIPELKIQIATKKFDVCAHGHPAIKNHSKVAYIISGTDGLITHF